MRDQELLQHFQLILSETTVTAAVCGVRLPMDEDDAEFFPQLTCSFHVAGPVGCSDAGG